MIRIAIFGAVGRMGRSMVQNLADFPELALANDFAGALRIHTRLLDLFADLFIEVNPVPVKAAMAMLGTAQEVYRLPLCEMRPENREKLRNTLSSLGLISQC